MDLPESNKAIFHILHKWDIFHGFDYHRVLSKYAININPFQSSQTKACQIVNLGFIIGFTSLIAQGYFDSWLYKPHPTG